MLRFHTAAWVLFPKPLAAPVPFIFHCEFKLGKFLCVYSHSCLTCVFVFTYLFYLTYIFVSLIFHSQVPGTFFSQRDFQKSTGTFFRKYRQFVNVFCWCRYEKNNFFLLPVNKSFSWFLKKVPVLFQKSTGTFSKSTGNF